MTADLHTRFLATGEHAAWNDFVARSPTGSPYSNTEYLDALCSAAGGSFRVLVAERAGENLGGVALYERQSRWGVYVEPRLLLQYNGFVLRAPRSTYPSENTAAQVEALTALVSAVLQQRYARVVLKTRHPLADGRPFQRLGWAVWPTYTYVVPLDDLAAQWNRVEPNLRRLVRRAERDGLRFTEDDDVEGLYRLHYDTHVRKGAPLYLREERFRSFVEQIRRAGIGRLFHARTDQGAAVASQLVLAGAHPVSHTVCAAADSATQKSGANAFLRWKALEALAASGSVANDLTDASLNPVTHFKSQLGGSLETCLAAVGPATFTWRAGTALEGSARNVLRRLRAGSRR